MNEMMAGDSNRVEIAPDKGENPNILLKSNIIEEKTPSLDPPSLPLRLNEIMGLSQKLNRQLEELAIERRTGVSQMQWAALEEFKSSSTSGATSVKFWRNSLFARTYFLDKDMDDCFQNIMKHCSIFNENLKDVNGKVQRRGDDEDKPEDSEEQQASGKSTRDKDAVDAVRRSFTELIRAKIDFDTRFISFNEQICTDACPRELRRLYANPSSNAERSPSGDKRRATDSKCITRSKRVARGITKKSRKEQLRRSTRIASEVKIAHRRHLQ